MHNRGTASNDQPGQPGGAHRCRTRRRPRRLHNVTWDAAVPGPFRQRPRVRRDQDRRIPLAIETLHQIHQHAIPAADQWTIIFSKNSTSWGSFSYDEKEDALRVTVKPHVAEFQELLAYTFDDVKPDSTAATLRWEKLAVPFRISVDVNTIVLASIQNQLRSVGGFTWAGYDEAATWLLDTHSQLDQAMKWEERSIASEERFDNLLTKSQILEAQGKKQEAEAVKARAFALASGFQLHAYGRGLQIQKRQAEGFAVFQINIQKRPNEWYTHGELARLASAKGDYATVTKELNLALASAPDVAKPGIKRLIARAEKKQDINP